MEPMDRAYMEELAREMGAQNACLQMYDGARQSAPPKTCD